MSEFVPSVPRVLRIVLPGGSGQVGQLLARHFQERGHHVTVLTRGPYTASWQTVHWDGANTGPWTEYLEGADAVINLSGRSINCRYTRENRRELYNSRIQTTQLLGRVIAGLVDPPRLWMNASAATIYDRALDANGVDLPLDELTGRPGGELPGAGVREFNMRLTRDWEMALTKSPTPLTRKVALRSGVVLSPVPGTSFGILSNLVRMSLGGTQGSGRQFIPWIHEADYARAVEFLIGRGDLYGPFNLTAPQPLPNREFMAALRDAWDVPNGLPAPSLAIRLSAIFLRTEPELVLGSCRAVPARLLKAGFSFDFPHWPHAAEDLVNQWRHKDD